LNVTNYRIPVFTELFWQFEFFFGGMMKRRSFLQGAGAASAALPVLGCNDVLMSSAFDKIVPKREIPKRILGKTGIPVTILGFGSHMSSSTLSNPTLRDKTIKAGYEGGINLFDVYDHSGYNQFNPMGQSLKGFRQNVVVSLCCVQAPSGIQKEIDGALTSFLTDYIDLYRLYTVDDTRVNYLENNKKAGKIRAIGIVSHDANEAMGYLDRYGDRLDFLMLVFNFYHNKGIYNDAGYPANDYSALIPRCKNLNIGIIGIKPLGNDAMVEFARKKGFFSDTNANICQAMLRYTYQNEDVHTNFVTMNNMQEVVTNLESVYTPQISDYEQTMLNNLALQVGAAKGAYLPDHYKWMENWRVKMA
jgi:predicted aldo/keto reductase-like oxidoreductase